MTLRWTAAAMLERERRFRRINGYRDMWLLERALRPARQGGDIIEDRGLMKTQRTAGNSTTSGTSSIRPSMPVCSHCSISSRPRPQAWCTS